MHKLCLMLLLLAVASVPGPLSGATLYANLPNAPGWTASTNAYSISQIFEISNSFDLSAPAVLQGVEFLSWNITDDFIKSVDWVISDGSVFSAFGTIHASGTAAVNSLFLSVSGFSSRYDLRSNTFDLPNINLGPGTYFLTLRNAVTDVGASAFWDVNGGPSEAWSPSGPLGGAAGTGSNSFSITGTTSDVPEPTTWTLFGVGLAALLFRRNRSARR